MAKMLVVVMAANAERTMQEIFGQMDDSKLPEGVKQLHTLLFEIELPKCADFFASLLHIATHTNRACVVSEVAPGTAPIFLPGKIPS